jgi:rubrerythrin/uncharacterized membrane protein
MANWQCSVCGYGHEGEEAPTQCPVCGSDRSKITPVDAVEDARDDTVRSSQDAPADTQRWQCAVCGYIHTGSEAPAQCPVCGAEKAQFAIIDSPPMDPQPQSTSQSSLAEDQRWQCTICGYIHTGSEPPETCPVCGADRSKFILLEDDKKTDAVDAEEPSPAVEPTVSQEPVAVAFLDRYQRGIDIAIDNHAHPIAVHIPNGVLPITVAMVLLAAVFDWSAIGQASVYNMGFIFVSMPVVLFTGYLHWQYKFGGHMTDLFKWKIICGGIVFVLSCILFVWGLASPESARHPGLVYLLLHFLMLGVAGVAGWLGGKLVFNPQR